jgi:hypothetical protein
MYTSDFFLEKLITDIVDHITVGINIAQVEYFVNRLWFGSPLSISEEVSIVRKRNALEFGEQNVWPAWLSERIIHI